MSDYFIVFLTDGQATHPVREIKNLKESLQIWQKTRGITSAIYCIGIGSSHDAALLNDLAQAGSNPGNFIYANTRESNISVQIVDALTSSIEQRLSFD